MPAEEEGAQLQREARVSWTETESGDRDTDSSEFGWTWSRSTCVLTSALGFQPPTFGVTLKVTEEAQEASDLACAHSRHNGCSWPGV